MLARVHAAAAWLYVAAIVVQVFLAGAALAQLGGSGDFRTHVDFGYTIVGVVALAVVITAVIARVGRRSILITVGLLVLYVIQTMLPYAKTSVPAIAALHPVNAAVLFALALWYAWQVTRRLTAAR
jgi:hypothetical protein